jgi:hypothetical protein
VAGRWAGAFLLLAGCTPFDVINPNVLTALEGQSRVASLPGSAPALLVTVENNTQWFLQAVVSLRRQETGVESYSVLVLPGDKTSQALVCPVDELTLGDVADPEATGAVLWLGSGSIGADAMIEVDPFNYVLRVDVNYDCGDAIRLVVQAGDTPSGYQIIAYRVPGNSP